MAELIPMAGIASSVILWLADKAVRARKSFRRVHRKLASPYVIALMLLLSGCEKWWFDRQMEELCKKDGGVRVYETIKLPPEMFDQNGDPFPGWQGRKSEDRLGAEYLVRRMEKILKDGDPLRGQGRLDRVERQVIRRSDGKLLGTTVSYGRSGGDFIAFPHFTSKGCPSGQKDNAVIRKIFLNKETKMSIINEYLIHSETALASYATALTLGQQNSHLYQSAGMTRLQAEEFDRSWQVLGQQDLSDGFSAVLFERIGESGAPTGEKVLAIRRSEASLWPIDYLVDVVKIALLGTNVGMLQYNSLESFYQSMIAQGKLTAAEQLTVTGHSLGGFLAQAFTAKHAAPGFSIAPGLLSNLGATGDDLRKPVERSEREPGNRPQPLSMRLSRPRSMNSAFIQAA